ncbi:MAG: hypothetical protein ACOY94_10250 [Bacillota bacterium]
MHAADALLRSAARWLLVVLPLGVWLRSAFVWAHTPGPFTWANLIHAHSHTAYFGWAGLGLMGLMLAVLPSLTGRAVADSAPLRWLLRLAPWAVGGALVTFAWQGYGGLSIAFSTLNEVLWFLFAALFWREVREQPVRRWHPALWLMGSAVLLLLLSSLGALVVIVAEVILKTSDPVLANLGIYLFLQAYGDGWLEVGLMGVAAALAPGALADRRLAGWQAVAMLALMAPASLRLLVPFGLSGPLLTAGIIAGVGLGVAQLAYLWNMRHAALPEAARLWFLLAGAALAVKALLEAVPLLDGWVAMAQSRNLVIAFLHLKLLLVVSAAMIGGLVRVGRGASRYSFWLFGLGTGTMVAALAAHGFWAAGDLALGQLLYQVAFWAGLLSATALAWAVYPSTAPALGWRPQALSTLNRQPSR